MTNNLSQYPQVQIQRATPSGLPSETTPPPMIEENDFPAWNTYQDSYLTPQTQHSYNPLAYRTHKRVSSGSSVGSAGPDSPYTQSTTYPQIVDTDAQSIHSAHLEPFDSSFSSVGNYSKPTLPPSAGLHSEQFFNPAYPTFNPTSNNADSVMASQSAMRQAINQQQGSNSSGGQNTSRRSFGGEMDGTSEMRSNTPMLDRTMSDIYQDELYNPALASSVPSSQAHQTHSQQGNLLSPNSRSTFSDLIQAANKGHISARSASPVTNGSRTRSPFRPESSEYGVSGFSHSNPSSPATRLITAAQMREQQKLESDAQAYAQHHHTSRHDFVNPPKTISPKEALLDYNETEEDVKMPLFPSEKREPQFSSVNLNNGRQLNRGNTDENSNEQSFGSMATSRRESSSNYSTSSAPQQASSNFTFMPPSVPGIPQQYPFISQSRRQSSSLRSGSDQVPEFPASLTSMESTRSDAGQAENVRIIAERSPPSSAESNIQRPSNTTANSGSYTCTTPNCHARFDTAPKLQKHRREAHRSSPHGSTPTTPSSATTPHNPQAAANNVSRNNAPGPHKCEKINPSTGKPCNTVFSRSYDLTRHEDTIHNNRKQKVRCHLCTEEKTFSRNDALTRHMRVVHPDVDFPGKSRRGRNNEGVDVVRQRIEGRRG